MNTHRFAKAQQQRSFGYEKATFSDYVFGKWCSAVHCADIVVHTCHTGISCQNLFQSTIIPPQSQFGINFGQNFQCAYYNSVVHSVLDPCTACMFLLLSKRLHRASRARPGCLCRRHAAALLRGARPTARWR